MEINGAEYGCIPSLVAFEYCHALNFGSISLFPISSEWLMMCMKIIGHLTTTWCVMQKEGSSKKQNDEERDCKAPS
jgi:hypothetical protein